MIINFNNVIKSKDLLQEYILPFLIDFNDRNETLSLKKVCKLWSELLNDPRTFPGRINLEENSFILMNNHLFLPIERGLIARIQQNRSSLLNKKRVQYVFEILPTDKMLITRSYLNRHSDINIAEVDSFAHNTVIFSGIALLLASALTAFSNIAETNMTEGQICMNFQSAFWKYGNSLCKNSANSFSISPSSLFNISSETVFDLNCASKTLTFNPIDLEMMSGLTATALQYFDVSSKIILDFDQQLHLGGIALAMIVVPIFALHISRGDFPKIRQFFRTVLSLEAPIKQAIKIENLRNRHKKISCGQKAIMRIASIFSGIRNAFRR